ncbi:MAG: haloacid dehalogenase-like hydrolase [Rhodospirillaceae bacterium]|nr:haloacid dehalogenase-like hydrolase [Rhodospirillaceae bacterium]
MHFLSFDLDGTLAESEAFDGELYVEVVRSEMGIDIEADWTGYRHQTDSGILNEIIDRSTPNADRSSLHFAVRRHFTDLVHDYVAARGGVIPEIPGAMHFVSRLMKHPSVRVAVATGGWKETALIKLRAIGLDPLQLSLASSSDAMSKVDIMRIAERRALPNENAKRKTYFGDSRYDKEASLVLGYDFIAIGENVDHHRRYPNFLDAESILDDLGLNGYPRVGPTIG